MSDRSTIFALSTGQPPSGIAVIRVSGPAASVALQAIAGVVPKPRMARRATLKGRDGEAIDESLVLWFPAPHSATGEDVAEFQTHGGRAIIAEMLATLGRLQGFRPAEPGELTRRAFENGKIDLVAAEGLDDLIHADTEQQRRQALRQLSGLLGDRARAWRERIIDAAALVEAGIDFSDEGDVAGDLMGAAREAIGNLRAEIADVLSRGGRGERLRDGIVVAIVGAPNVGKSTLLNTLARREVAIVSAHAGTTRDVLEVHLDLAGYPVTLVDTAGLREAADPVEQEGIRRAEARAASADLVLWLDDGDFAGKPPVTGGDMWRLASKADRVDPGTGADDTTGFVRISAHTGAGIDRLIADLAGFATAFFAAESALITRQRHRALLIDAEAALARALGESEPELVAEELRAALFALGRLLGRVDVEDVLGSIFERFCIGK